MTLSLTRSDASTTALGAGPTLPRPVTEPMSRLRRPRPSRDWFWKSWHWRLFLLVITFGTFGMHVWRLNESMDLFIDEPFYAQVSQSIARGYMPYAEGSYFFLHPPAFFYVAAGWMRVFGLHSDVFAQVYSLRKLIAVIAALTALTLALLVERVVGRTAAALVAVFYATNSFAIQQTSLVLLEPITLMWTLVGYTIFTRISPPGSKWRRRQVILAGLAFGVACLSKEFAVFVTLLPLALAWLLKCWITRREAVLAMVMTALPWGAWVAAVYLTGHWSDFATQVTSGFHRTTGKSQISGFNKAGAPSFLDTIFANLISLWTAYAILGLGTVAIVYLAIKAKDDQRLRFVTLFGLGAIPLLMYCVTLGTNEEQFFNFLFFPGLICLVAYAWLYWRRLALWTRNVLLLLVAAAIVGDYSEYMVTHLKQDNGTYQVDKWMYDHVPEGTAVAVTNSVQREIFLRYHMVDDKTGKDLVGKADYLVVFYKQIDEGYAFVGPRTIAQQIRGQKVVFATEDDSNGRMVVYAIS